LFKGGKHIRVTVSQIAWNAHLMMKILRTSLGGIGQMLVGMMSWIFIVRILAELGSEVVAGSTIAVRIMMFTTMPAWGLSNAAATLVGQNLGAGEPGRAESAVWKSDFIIWSSLSGYLYCSSFTIGGSCPFFTEDAKVIAVGAEWLRILSYSYFVYGWWMVSVQAFNGAGDTRTPTYINLVFFWLIQIPLSWFMAIQLGMEQTGYSGRCSSLKRP
jgi:Na+-driven multidrug efflux pump